MKKEYGDPTLIPAESSITVVSLLSFYCSSYTLQKRLTVSGAVISGEDLPRITKLCIEPNNSRISSMRRGSV